MQANQHLDPSTTVGIFGHSESEYHDYFNGDKTLSPALYQPGIYYIIDQMINNGTQTFLTGLKSGIQCWLAEYVLMNKVAYIDKEVTLCCVLDSPDDLLTISDEAKKIVSNSDCVYLGTGKEDDTERFIVEHSSGIISIHFAPVTALSVRLARQAGKPVYSLDPKTTISQIMRKYRLKKHK